MDEADLAIIGAGISGLTTAAALRRRGLDPVVLERSARFAPVGAGIQLAPNAVRLLDRIGIGPRLEKAAALPESIDLQRWVDGSTIARTTLGAACRERYGSPYLTLHRADLIDALLDTVGRDRVVTGATLERLEPNDQAVTLRWQNREPLRVGVAVGADGIRSTVRRHLVADRPTFSRQAIYRAVVDASDVPLSLRTDHRVRLWLGPDKHAVCYPISSGQQFSVGATVEANDDFDESWTEPGDQPSLLAAYRGWDPELMAVLEAAVEASKWALHDRDPLLRWSNGRVVVIGDAAHPMLPFMAQGANQAVEDAFALARYLAEAEAARPQTALRRFEQDRMARTTAVQRGSRRNKQRLHLDDGGAQEARDKDLASHQELADHDWLFGHDAENPAPPRNTADAPRPAEARGERTAS